MDRWKKRARIYHWFRKMFPVNRYFQEEKENIQSLVERISGEIEYVADLGTGIGDSLRLLPEGKFRILLDASLEMLSRSWQGNNDFKVLGDALHLPLKRHSLQLITCIGVSEYLPSIGALLHEIYESLQPNGYALITFSRKNWRNRLRNLLGKKINSISGSTAHDLLAAQNFYIVWAYKSTLQQQFLVQKIISK